MTPTYEASHGVHSSRSGGVGGSESPGGRDSGVRVCENGALYPVGFYIDGAASTTPMRREPRRMNGEIWGITTYFNPANYSNKLTNLKMFSAAARRQSLNLLIVEASFGDQPFVLDESLADVIIRVRVQDMIWMKECLINIGVRALPRICDRVVWVDADLLFENDDWVEATNDLLEQYAAVQPFGTAHWLKRDVVYERYIGPSDRRLADSCFFRTSTASEEFVHPDPFKLRGHMGFAWGMRRSIIEQVPLYEGLVVGGGDYIAASAMYGLAAKPWISAVCTEAMKIDITRWMKNFHYAIRGSVAHVPGDLLHLWHGERDDRQYLSRYGILLDEEFDPTIHLRRDSHGCLRWSDLAQQSLRTRVRDYFSSRKEE